MDALTSLTKLLHDYPGATIAAVALFVAGFMYRENALLRDRYIRSIEQAGTALARAHKVHSEVLARGRRRKEATDDSAHEAKEG